MENGPDRSGRWGRRLRLVALTAALSALPPLQLLPPGGEPVAVPRPLLTIDYAEAATLEKPGVRELVRQSIRVPDPATRRIHLGLVLILMAGFGASTLRLWQSAVRGTGR